MAKYLNTFFSSKNCTCAGGSILLCSRIGRYHLSSERSLGNELLSDWRDAAPPKLDADRRPKCCYESIQTCNQIPETASPTEIRKSYVLGSAARRYEAAM